MWVCLSSVKDNLILHRDSHTNTYGRCKIYDNFQFILHKQYCNSCILRQLIIKCFYVCSLYDSVFFLTDRVCAHRLGVRGEGKESEAVEDHPVEEAVEHVLGRQQHDEHHHELGVEDQKPGDDAAHDAAAVADEPHGAGAGAGRGRGAVLGLQVASLPLDVPGAVPRALHPTTPVSPTTYCEEGGEADGEEEGERRDGKKMKEEGN